MASRRTFPNIGLERFSGLYLGAAFILVFGLWVPDLFLAQATLHSVAAQQAITGMLALAVVIPLAAGVFDLSIGAIITFTAVMVCRLQTENGLSMVPAIIISVALGGLIGATNGFFVVKLRISSFIATLASATLLSAVQQIVTDQTQPLQPIAQAWLSLSQRTVFGFQMVFVYLLVLAVIVWWVLEHTPAGRYIHATGGNPEAARLTGVRIDTWVWLSFIASGTISGLAGVFYASLIGPSLNFGSALLLPAYAAAFLGATQVKPGRFNVWGTIIAVYVLAIGVQGLQFVTDVQWLPEMFNGSALIVAVAFATWRQTRVVRPRRRPVATTDVEEATTGPSAAAPAGAHIGAKST